MGLRDTYAHAIQTAKGKFHGNAEERDGKLYFKGTVATDAEKNEIWNAIKTIPTWQKDIVADIQVTGGPAAGAGATSTAGTAQGGTALHAGVPGKTTQPAKGGPTQYPQKGKYRSARLNRFMRKIMKTSTTHWGIFNRYDGDY